jgi:putative transposase
VKFVNDHKDRSDGGRRWGVESICAVLTEHGIRIAPSTYYEAVSRPPSARALRDEQLRPRIEKAFEDSGRTFGPRRVWRALNDDGITVARCTIERLMNDMRLHSTLGRGQSGPHP